MTSRVFPVICLVILVLSCAVGSSSSDNLEKWLQDFEHLKSELADGYANLEWTANHNNMNLAALATEMRLRRPGLILAPYGQP